MTEIVRQFISLGAGVQSSTMALMAAAGEITPMPDAAIFADTQWEPAAVYEWLTYLETQLPFPVIRVTHGSLKEAALQIRTSAKGNLWSPVRVPAFTLSSDTGRRGLLQRQCTKQYKILPIIRALRKLRAAKGDAVCSWIGISKDEASRMKDSREQWIRHRWPLIELSMSRADCLTWMRLKGFPKPPRSACQGCAFRSKEEWASLTPEEFADVVAWERRYQKAVQAVQAVQYDRAIPFLHPSRIPLGEVSFAEVPDPQRSLWGNECEGVCGV